MYNRRILLIGPCDPGALAGSYRRAFERLGYEVFAFDSERAYRQDAWFAQNRILRRALRKVLWDRLNRSALEIAWCVQPIMILAVKCCWLEAETVCRLRTTLRIPVVNYYPDHPYSGVPLDPRTGASTQRRNLIEVLRQYSAVWVWEQGLARRLSQDGVRARFLPFGVDSDLFYPRPEHPPVCAECGQPHEVVFIGHHNPKRGQHIGAIRGHSVGLWGDGWRRMGESKSGLHRIHRAPVFGADVAQIYSCASVALNIVGDLNIPGHNMRTFEIPASGGIMLAHYTAEQTEFFPEDEAAAYYRTPAELDEKIEGLLHHAQMRQSIRRNALRLAAAHAYTERAAVMLRQLELPVTKP